MCASPCFGWPGQDGTAGTGKVGNVFGPEDERIELVEDESVNVKFVPDKGPYLQPSKMTVPITLHHIHFYVPANSVAEIKAWYVKTLALSQASGTRRSTLLSMQVADYRKTRDFYSGLFGMKVTEDDGKTQCRLTFGDNILIPRNASSRPGGTVEIDHIAYTLANWDTDKTVKPAVEAELKRRGLKIRATEGSFHVQDPDGFEVRMGGKRQ